MKKITLLSIFCFGIAFPSWSQKILIKEDPTVAQMMKKFVELNKQKKNVSGWRVQIASTTDRRMMDEVLKNFQLNHPDIPITWIHAKPYYQVRAGAFKTKLESMRLLSMLKQEFPDAYLVADNTIKQADLAGVKQ